MLNPGDTAPNFTALDQHGQPRSLNEFSGKKVALYFYPKDDTPGCTAQACNLRDQESELQRAGIQVIGVSIDDVASHEKFAGKYKLNFPLLADTDRQIVEAYGVWREKNMYGKKYMGTARVTFLIDEQGHIERIIEKVKTDAHAGQLLA